MASMFNLSDSVSTTTSLWCDFISAIICHFHTSNVLLYCILLLLIALDQFGAVRGHAHSDMHSLSCSYGVPCMSLHFLYPKSSQLGCCVVMHQQSGVSFPVTIATVWCYSRSCEQ